MHGRIKIALVLILTMVISFGAGLITAHGQNIIKGAIVLTLVNTYGKQLNDGINKLTGNKNLSPGTATKVVPIFSIGQGAYLGAAQVAGQDTDLAKVKAVGQIEAKLIGNQFRVKALVPITDVKKIERVQGVGTSAIIDIKL